MKTLHKYLYVGSNPVNYVDPRGRDLFEYSIRSSAAVPEAKLIDASQRLCVHVYTRDNDGNKTLETELNGRNTNWSYDGINQLTTESVSSDPNQNKNGSVSYSLDAVGNRLSTTSSLSGISSSSSTFNADDRQSTEAYDTNGNVLSTGGKNYSYDSQNQLVSANAGTVGLVYDGMGERVAKSANGATTHFLVDDLSPTGFPQVVQETVNGAVTRTYTYGLQRISQEQVILNNWTSSFYGYDGGGNVRLLTDSSGNITDTYEYDAFGNQISTTGSTPNEFLYRGEQWDPDLSLYYLRARYYNPVTGRFMSQDPYDGEVHDPASLHRYRYANGNPANFVDPSGQASITEYANNVLSVLGRAAPVVEFANEVLCVYNAEAEGLDLVNNWQHDTRVQRAMRITSLGLTAATCGASIKGIGGPPEVEPVAPGEPESLPEPEPAGCCFAAGTLVHTDHGDVPVEKIKVGDRVLSHSASTGKNEFEPVTALTPPHQDKLLELSIDGEKNVLRPSEDHPFWVKSGDGDSGHWIEAANLRPGELLETIDGRWRKINSATQLDREETVYNFTVDKDHDYFVGQTGFLVHNARCRCTVFGRKTGKFYKGISGRAGRQANINPILLQLATELFGRIGAEVPGAAPVGSCAEFDAANQALNDGNDLNDLEFGPANIGGIPKPPCPVCQIFFGLVP